MKRRGPKYLDQISLRRVFHHTGMWFRGPYHADSRFLYNYLAGRMVRFYLDGHNEKSPKECHYCIGPGADASK
jgi:hypothetical protein